MLDEAELSTAAASIVLTGLGFWFLDLVVGAVAKRYLLRGVQGDKVSATEKEKAEAVATQAVTRIVGFVHNSIQIPLALSVLLDPAFIKNPLYHTSTRSSLMLIISAGYFLHDLVFCIIRFHLEGPFYLLHAFCCLIAYAYGVYSGFLHYYGAAFLMWEASTPFVHLRWFLYKLGWENTQVYVLNGVAMVLSFFLARIAWGYFATYRLYRDLYYEAHHPRPGGFPVSAMYVYVAASMSLNLLNTYWFGKMAERVGQVVLGGKKPSEINREKDE